MPYTYEVVYITKLGKEKCYGDFEADEVGAIECQQWLEYIIGLVAWVERI